MTERAAVDSRDRSMCVRCAGRGYHWHHRRSRRVKDAHRNCTCNGVMLCSTCHNWVHMHPTEAKAVGLIVSEFCEEPGMVPFQGAGGWWWSLGCHGEWTYEPHVTLDEGIPLVVRG